MKFECKYGTTSMNKLLKVPVKSPEKNNMKKVKIVLGTRRVYRYVDSEKLGIKED